VTTYRFSDHAGSSLSFNPATDILAFSTKAADAALGGSAAQLRFIVSGDDLLVGLGGATVQLQGVRAAQLGPANLVFDDGSLFLAGTGAAELLTGGGGADYLDGRAGADTMKGGDGSDVYIVDNVGDLVAETADQGWDTVRSRVSYTLTNHVENLILTGTAAINGVGNNLNNTLTGNSGDNVLDGGTGVDYLIGGFGNDTYIVNGLGLAITESTNGGTDTVLSQISFALGAHLENITLTGTAAINALGNAVGNILIGNANDNLLDGKGGGDVLIGGAGNDTYVVDSLEDLVQETGGGVDTVLSEIDLKLGSGLENLGLTGTAVHGTGNATDNVLTGNNADNVLDGRNGADTLAGGLGNDTYYVSESGDRILEATDAGVDTVRSRFDFTLSDDIENLVLLDGALSGTGNDLANTLIGNSGSNRLDGGAGDDRLDGGGNGDEMHGGLGNDTYILDDVSDWIIEESGAGIDTVLVRNDGQGWLPLAEQVENLILGANSSVGVGNSLDNVLVGNADYNLLDGGAGADLMRGGAGDDDYIVDNSADVVREVFDGGFDSVSASASYTLGANVERLILTGWANVNGVGNGLQNFIDGNSGDNFLDGRGGVDVMYGGAGNDTYVIDSDYEYVDEDSSESGGANDTVLSNVDFFLFMCDGLEHLTLTGSAELEGWGNDSNNILTGNIAANLLVGEPGDDILIGGGGQDTLWGGPGSDVFRLLTLSDSVAGLRRDDVRDFLHSEGDLIDLAAIDANADLGGNQAFSFIGSAAFSSVDATGQLRFANEILYGSIDADSTAEFSIQLAGVSSLTAGDLLL